ncbi:Yop proteins translocation protein L [compost metagenome]
MALIKSSQLVKKGTAVVAGDSIQTADVEALLPQTPVPAPNAPVEQGPVGLGVDLGHPMGTEDGATGGWGGEGEGLEATVPAMDPALETEGDPLETDEAYADPEDSAPSYVDAFDGARDSLLGQAEEAAQAGLQEVQAGFEAEMAQAIDSEMGAAQAAIYEAYEPGSPEAQAALEAVGGTVERAAQAIARRNAILEVNRSRWQEMASAEEQIAALLDNFHAHLAEEPPLEDQVVALLGEREAILAEARLAAERLVLDAQARAAVVVQEAEASAARTLLEVETRRQQILDGLKQQGYSEGYQEGRGQADEEGAKIINEATDSLNQMAGALREAVKQNEEKILQLAVGIAEKILHDEIVLRPDTVLKTLEEALMKVSDLEEVTIKVHPEDMPTVQTQEDAIRDRLKSVRKVDFASSAKIQRGGVLIETGSGTVDAQIKTQLSVIQEAFEFVRKEYAEEPLDMTGSS